MCHNGCMECTQHCIAMSCTKKGFGSILPCVCEVVRINMGAWSAHFDGRCEPPHLILPFHLSWGSGEGQSDVAAPGAFGSHSAVRRWVAVVALGAVTRRVLLRLAAGRWALQSFSTLPYIACGAEVSTQHRPVQAAMIQIICHV